MGTQINAETGKRREPPTRAQEMEKVASLPVCHQSSDANPLCRFRLITGGQKPRCNAARFWQVSCPLKGKVEPLIVDAPSEEEKSRTSTVYNEPAPREDEDL
jgi:hypothetical protein